MSRRCSPGGLRWVGIAVVLLAMPFTEAWAHTVWSDGSAVPEWVRDACCGPSDVHHLMAAQVHAAVGGYRVDGIQAIIPFAKTLPSQDGDYWIFYRKYPDGTQYVFCFFAPAAGL